MSNFGGPNSKFEKDFAKRFKSLDETLSKIELKIKKILIFSMKNPKLTNGYWKDIRREIQLQYANMVIYFNSWIIKELPLRLRNSIRGMQKRFNTIKAITNTATKTASQLINSRGATEVARLLIQNAQQDFAAAAAGGLRNVNRWTRLTQQKLISDAQIDLTIGSIFIEEGNLGKAVTGVKTDLWNQMTKSLEQQHYIQAGNRKYRPRYYAEMVSRVKFHEAHSEASFLQAANYNTDLMQVSSHNTTTTLCQEYEGKIFSISGKDKRFPLLTFSSPFHPNCLHLMFPTFESALIAQGTLDSFSAFSKGRISRPPVPAGFIPLKERSA